ncbi:septum site-determining protein MinC [Candidimonas humi]|nr:septum site-determining protein MinC [Candidimonas humi]
MGLRGNTIVSETSNQRDAQPVLDIKSASLYALRVVLRTSSLSELQAALAQRMRDAGSFFENEPVVIDASGLEEPLDWAALAQELRNHKLHPIGAIAPDDQRDAAAAQGLPSVELAKTVPRPAATPAPEHDIPPVAAPPAAGSASATAAPAKGSGAAQAAPASAQGKAAAQGKTAAKGGTGRPAQPSPAPEHPAVAPAAMVISRPLRSGQRVYARDTDLIVIGVVSQGAEVIADGNIHVYGPLRGKAMAGARGDTSARIFTTELDPELLAIAGVYRVIETRLEPALHGKPGIVQLEGESLRIVPVED